jgi:hypothetical protein
MFISSINVEANTTEAIFAGLEFGNNYSFKIVTESPYEDEIISSESLNFNLTLLSLEAPAYLEGHITSEQSVQLAWFDYSALETGFLVERKVNDGSFIEIATLSEMNLTSFVDRDISEFETGDLLTYRLKSYNDYEASIAFSDYSNEIVVEVEEISDDTIYIYFTSYNYFYTSWNIRKEGSNELVFPEFQTLDAPCQMMLRKVNLEAGKYYMHCLDTNGYGGIGGSVYQGTNLLTSWEIGSFVTNGHFHFEVTNK